MSEISKVIASEIADFFAGFGGPGEPDIQSGEAQRLLTGRVLSVLALRERAEPVAGENLPCPFCGGACDPAGWLSEQTSGPDCENCGATAENIEAWNRRTAALVVPDDTKRLDWLDSQNKRLNEYYGTAYGWKFDANFQRNAMMLNDSNYPVMTVRQAIDEAMLAAPGKEG